MILSFDEYTVENPVIKCLKVGKKFKIISFQKHKIIEINSYLEKESKELNFDSNIFIDML